MTIAKILNIFREAMKCPPFEQVRARVFFYKLTSVQPTLKRFCHGIRAVIIAWNRHCKPRPNPAGMDDRCGKRSGPIFFNCADRAGLCVAVLGIRGLHVLCCGVTLWIAAG
jgi:hypothetical protein